MIKDIFKKKKENKIKKIIPYVMCVLPFLLYGCNTMEGAGTDIKEAGKALERSADKHKPDSRPCPCCNRR